MADENPANPLGPRVADDLAISRDTRLLLASVANEVELVEGLLGPVGALMRYVRIRLGLTLQLSATLADASAQELIDAAAQREDFGDLLMRALEAARLTRLVQKRNALARAIAYGYLADDDAAVDRENLLVRIIDRLEMPHIRAIEIVAQHPDVQVEKLLAENMGEEGLIVAGALASESLVVPQIDWDSLPSHVGLSPTGEQVGNYLAQVVGPGLPA
ncbi:MAG: hypothetical protein ACXV8R_10760 [Acidimicrobiia bacterium]